MNQSDEIKSNNQTSLYNTVNKISQQQSLQLDNQNHAQKQQKQQKILSLLQQSNIIQMQQYQPNKIKQINSNTNQQNQPYDNDNNNQLASQKITNKFTIKPSINKHKLQHMSIQYLDLLFKSLRCLKHYQSTNNQQLFICLQSQCDCDILPQQHKINNLITSNDKYIKQNKSSKITRSSIKSTLQYINGNQYHQKQINKQHKIKSLLQKDISSQIIRSPSIKKLQQKILCQQCLNSKLHRGHQICTLKKFQSLICQYHWTSIQATKDLLSKIIQLKNNLDFHFNMLSNKIVQIMTLGMINDWEEFRNNFYKYNLSKNISSKLLQKNKQYQSQLYYQSTINKSPFSNKQSTNQNINIQNSLNINKLFQLNALQIWQQLLNTQNNQQIQTKLNKILKFKQDNILQQIQYIDNNFKDVINSSIKNLQFVNNYKNWIFNPDDMSQGQIGLTLDRNKVQGLKKNPQPSSSPISPNSKHPPPQSPSKKPSSKNNNKIVFTQKPLSNQNSRSFKIQKLNSQIFIGCVNNIDHVLISQKLYYSLFKKYLSGISVNLEGLVTVYNKGQKPYIAQFCKLSQNDIIQVTLHSKNSTITFIKYSQSNEYVDQQIAIKSKISLKEKIKNRTVIATLPIQLIDCNCVYHLMAGVSGEGDCVSLVENILIQSRISNSDRKKMRQSQKMMQNYKESIIQNQPANDNFKKMGNSQKVDKSLS